MIVGGRQEPGRAVRVRKPPELKLNHFELIWLFFGRRSWQFIEPAHGWLLISWMNELCSWPNPFAPDDTTAIYVRASNCNPQMAFSTKDFAIGSDDFKKTSEIVRRCRLFHFTFLVMPINLNSKGFHFFIKFSILAIFFYFAIGNG